MNIIPYELRCDSVPALATDSIEPTVVPASSVPMLSWKIRLTKEIPDGTVARQTAYRIAAATSSEKLEAGDTDLWDSGEVISAQQLGVAYAGKLPGAGEKVWWMVCVWDGENKHSVFSEPACFERGLGADEWKASWIAEDTPPPADDEAFFHDRPAPLFRKEFTLAKPVRSARAYVSGLGYAEFRLNGAKVGARELDPAWTSYAKRVFYATYDVTALLREGANTAGAIVGNGWFNPLPMKMWGRFNLREALTVGAPRLLAQIDVVYDDGTKEQIVTDATWQSAASPIVRNSVYLGERYDARLELPGWDAPGFDASAWKPAVLAPAEPVLGALEPQSCPPIRVTDTLPAAAITEPQPGVYLLDFGENLTGRVRFRCSGPEGTRIQIRYGELRYDDGALNPMTSVAGQIKNREVPEGSEQPATAWQCDAYILKGKDVEEYAPRFTFHGFRYAEVTGWPGVPTLDAFTAERLHTDVPSAGEFACSNDLFNRIQEISVRSLRGNILSVQSDCPHREKFGYGGDIVADGALGLCNYDMATFYRKIARDFGDAVRPNGGFTETAPFVGIADQGLGDGSGPIGWGTAQPLLLFELYMYYGDEAMVREGLPAAQRYLDLIASKATNYIVDSCIGDHESLAEKDMALSSTVFFYMNARIVARLSALAGDRAAAEKAATLAGEIAKAFQARFYDAATGKYGLGTQACQAFALIIGLVPDDCKEKALEVLTSDIAAHDGALTTGIFGTPYMLHALVDYGRGDLAYTIVNRRAFPGWGHMLENGATTLWEHWEFSDNTFSHNHPMFGSVSEWFYSVIAGIAPEPDACGYNHIRIAPHILGDLTWARAKYESVRGTIASAWRVENGALTLDVTIPPNTAASVIVPAKKDETVRIDGAPAETVATVKLLSRNDTNQVFAIPPGTYSFSTPM